MSFVGEVAVDTGGPLREFFRLLAEKCRNSVYLSHADDPCGSFFSCNTSGYQVHTVMHILFWYKTLSRVVSGDYKTLGIYAGMSIIQGGPGFSFMHTSSPHTPIADQGVQDVVHKVLSQL